MILRWFLVYKPLKIIIEQYVLNLLGFFGILCTLSNISKELETFLCQKALQQC